MRAFSVLFTLFALLTTAVLAWEKEDHEIFDLVSELETAEGKGTTFYSWLEVPSTATTNEIAKAYRKKSITLHPDKNPDVKGIHERFARLGVISTILRNKETRERYDFFYKNGVPKWRGTGYYYQRFRPGLGFVLSFLVVLTSGIQYMIQKINYKKDLQRIEDIISKARAAAWGPKLIPVTGQRKVRVNLGSDARDEDGHSNNRWLDMVVDEQHVYLLENGDLHLIDSSTAPVPAITNTWFISLIKGLVSKVTGGRLASSSDTNGSAPDVDSDDDSSSAPGSGTSTPRNGESEKGGKTKLPTSKAGGMRRKNIRKK